MSTPDISSEVLNFNAIKRRSVAARNYRVKINPTNSGTFTGSSSSQLEFVLPSNLSGSYIDFSNLYLKMTVTNTNAANLDKAGAYGFISRVEMYTAGSQICTVNNFNVLAATLMDTDATIGYKGGFGKVLSGLQASGSLGEYSPAGGVRTYCIPLILLPFCMQKKLIPLFSLDSLRIRFTFENVDNVFVAAASAGGYTIADAQLCGYVCELSPAAQMQIDQMTGGVYNILCPCYSNIQTTMTAGAAAVTSTLGIAVSSLERILIVHRVSASINSAAKQSIGGRITNGLSNFQFSIDSQLYPQNPILVGNAGAEAAAEFLLSSGSLSSFQNDAHIASQLYMSSYTSTTQTIVNQYEGLYGYLQIPATDTTKNTWFNVSGDGSLLAANAALGAVSTAGSFVAAIELENSTSSARSDLLYSGVSSLGSVVQYIGAYSGAVAATIDFFCYYTIMCSLNMKTTGVWQVSV